jgi:tetratricopeptide (TPR) repeat protein
MAIETEQVSAMVVASAARSRKRTLMFAVLGVLVIALGVVTTVRTIEAGKQVQQVTVQNTVLQKTTTTDQTEIDNQKKVQKYLSDGAEFSRAGQYDEAEASYKEALALDPNNSVALSYAGYLAYKKHDYDSAATMLQKATTIDPNYAWSHYNLALALDAKGDTDGATEQIATLVHKSPKFKATIQGDVQFKALRKLPAVQELLAP